MNLKKYFTLILITLSLNSFAQQLDGYSVPRPKNCDTENSCPRNTIFHETTFRFTKLGLNWNSINWDHILVCREWYLLSFRLGLDYYSMNKIRSIGAPIDLNLMIGGGAIMFETGIGLNYLYIYRNYDEVTATRFDDNLSYVAATGRLGLRYQKKHSLFFRLGYTPMYSLMGNEDIQIKTKKDVYVIRDRPFYSMFGAGIGYTF